MALVSRRVFSECPSFIRPAAASSSLIPLRMQTFSAESPSDRSERKRRHEQAVFEPSGLLTVQVVGGENWVPAIFLASEMPPTGPNSISMTLVDLFFAESESRPVRSAISLFQWMTRQSSPKTATGIPIPASRSEENCFSLSLEATS